MELVSSTSMVWGTLNGFGVLHWSVLEYWEAATNFKLVLPKVQIFWLEVQNFVGFAQKFQSFGVLNQNFAVFVHFCIYTIWYVSRFLVLYNSDAAIFTLPFSHYAFSYCTFSQCTFLLCHSTYMFWNNINVKIIFNSIAVICHVLLTEKCIWVPLL